MVLKRNHMRGHGLGSSGSTQGQVESCCKFGS